MHTDQLKQVEADALIERMRTVRSAGYSHADEIQEEAKRLIDWKEYVLTKPLTSVAATFLLGFVVVRNLARPAPELAPQDLNANRYPSSNLSLGSTIARGALTLATSVVSSALRKYVSQFTQDYTFGRESSDPTHEFKS